MVPRPLEEEVGVWRGKTDLTFRQTAEHDQNRVAWNLQQRVWLEPSNTSTFLTRVSVKNAGVHQIEV